MKGIKIKDMRRIKDQKQAIDTKKSHNIIFLITALISIVLIVYLFVLLIKTLR